MSLVEQYHAAHKERLARINARAVIEPKIDQEPIEPVVVPFKPKDDPLPFDAGWPGMWFYELVSPKKIRIKDVQEAVCEFYRVFTADLISQSRTARIVRPRQVAMYLCRTLTPRSLPEIGRKFGGRDHTTVLHAVQKIEQLMQSDSVLADEVNTIQERLET